MICMDSSLCLTSTPTQNAGFFKSKIFTEGFPKIFFLLVIEQTLRRHRLYAGLVLGTGNTAETEQTRACVLYVSWG